MLWDYLLISGFIWVREIKVNPMIYENLFEQAGGKRIRAGLIGTGTYGISLFEQSQFISRLEIPVICDQEPEAAQRAYQRAGISDEDIVICKNRKELLQALESGKSTIAENYTLLMNAPLDVIIECTGNPEARAKKCSSYSTRD
jgi:predicted homoserine dehydrogenase-like protein